MRPCEIVKLVEYIKEQTGHTGDIFININDNAIPIEWIEQYIWSADTHDEKRALRKMCIQWEEENEKDI